MAFGDHVQSRSTSNANPSVLAFSSNVTANNFLVVRYYGYASDDTVTDSQGNVYSLLATSGSPGGLPIWVARAGSTGACTVTVTKTATTVQHHHISEYTGPWIPGAFQGGAAAGGTGTATNSGNVTPDQNGSIYLGFHLSNTALTEAGGWTTDGSLSAGGVETIITHTVQAVAAADAAEATMAVSSWGAAVAVFSPNVQLAGSGSYALTGSDLTFELARTTSGGLIFDYVLAQESSEAIWPSRMSQLADWAVPAYLTGERVVLYTKSGSNQIWIMGESSTGTLHSYIDLPWVSRLDDTKVAKWLGLIAAYSSTVAVDVYVRYANNPGEFDAATWTLRGTLPANPTIAEGARIGFGGSTRWVQVRFRAETLAGGGFELFPPIHLIPVDTQRIPN